MIHKQYMDLSNTSPTLYFLLFFYLPNASLQGVKAISCSKTVHWFVLTHQSQKKNDPPFANVIKHTRAHTHARVFHLR